MIIDGKQLDRSQSFQADICIIGAGVAGIVLAKELMGSGKKVLLIDSGGEHYDQATQDIYQAEKFPETFPDPHYSRLRFLGGTSNHWENNTSPFSPIDFEKRAWVPNSGWPISFKDIEPYYLKAAYYCGTKEDSYDTSYWAKQLNAKDLLADSKAIETSMAKSSIPPVRFFHQYGDSLKTSDQIRILTHANLIDIEFNSKNKKVESVTVQSFNSIKHSISAESFVFCMGGIENARMLLIFNEKYQNQLGNQGDSVGRYFMEHPTVRAAHFFARDEKKFKLYERHNLGERNVLGFFQIREEKLKEAETTNVRMPLIAANNYELSDGISSFHVISDAAKNTEVPDDFGTHIFNILADIDMVAEAVSRKSLDKSLFDSADEFAGFQIPMMTEQSPYRENRIKLGSDIDALGLKRIIIDWQVMQHDKDLIWKSLEVVAREVGALGLGRLKIMREHKRHIWGSQLGFAHHHMGTTRMADSPKDGVVDSNLKVFGCDNLYIAGSSSFSTGSHVPPTLTIAALSLRLSDHLKGLS